MGRNIFPGINVYNSKGNYMRIFLLTIISTLIFTGVSNALVVMPQTIGIEGLEKLAALLVGVLVVELVYRKIVKSTNRS
jgi:hypothetical protein